MIRNNIKAICIHGVISLSSFLIFIIFFSSIPKWVSEEAEKLYYFKMTLVSLIVLIGATYLYNTYSLPLVFILDVDYIFYLFSILFSFIPSISMTAGILMNKRLK